MKKIVYWLPRILAILITAFWFVFVFASHGLSFESLIESGVWIFLLLLTVLAWQEKLIGKLGFIILGIFYIVLVWNRAPNKIVILEVAGPVLLTGILFLFSKKEYKTKVKKSTKSGDSLQKESQEDNGKII